MEITETNLSFNQGRYSVGLTRTASGTIEDTKHQRTYQLYRTEVIENPILSFRYQSRRIYLVFEEDSVKFYKTHCAVASNTVVAITDPVCPQARAKLLEWMYL